MYNDSSDDEVEIDPEVCPRCLSREGPASTWIGCVKCPKWWHRRCSGDPLVVAMNRAELEAYPFHCDLCL